MLNRKDICKVCLNHEKDKDFGIICGLTLAEADFIGSCSDFIHDPEVNLPENFQNYYSSSGSADSKLTSRSAVKRAIGKKLISFSLLTLGLAVVLFVSSNNYSIDKSFEAIAFFIGVIAFIVLVIGFIIFGKNKDHYRTEEDELGEEEIE